MSVDLHLHSYISDGSDSPADVVRHAAAAGLTTLALTDHDTLDGIAEARATAAEVGIDFIPGTELSVDWPTGTMHMLVYFLEPGPGPLQDRLAEIVDARTNRNRLIVEKLNTLDIDITYDEVITEAKAGVVGRPHIAAVMEAKGYVTDIKDAFDRYLANGRPGYVDRMRLEAHEAIDLALASGGAPVIAHPHTLGVSRGDYGSAFAELAEAGLVGIESFYSEYTPDVRSHLAGLCDQLGLVATGGSDYHGRYKKDLYVGRGRGDLNVPDSAAENLKAARPRV